MSSTRETVLVVGATGYTGREIAKALAYSQRFDVRALVRPSSLHKSLVEDLRNLGLVIVPGDIAKDSPSLLLKHLEGIDFLISTVVPLVDQRPLLLAAKEAGVKRVVPSDFGPHIPKGVFWAQDLKLSVRDFILENSIPHTFIEVAIWVNTIFPLPHAFPGHPLPESGKEFKGTGKEPVAWIDYNNLGKLFPLILGDPRTFNQAVYVYDGETTLDEAWSLGAKLAGEDFSDYLKVNAEQVEQKAKLGFLQGVIYGYAKALYIRGDSAVTKAVDDGVLDSHALYPQHESLTLEEAGKKFYSAPPVFKYDS
ncbi:NAD(P)-binding protein [Flagelloscypha sp. PMI_526]|nr:NAD(P)-binding protein [Flagelloscypha sp. PMI_526]